MAAKSPFFACFFRKSAVRSVSFFLTAFVVLAVGCRKTDVDFGSGQRASQADVVRQNQNLIAQVVLATEELERHPDPAYLQNALSRLNTWLKDHPQSRDFQPVAEMDALAAQWATLSDAASKLDQDLMKFLDPDAGATEADGDALAAEFDAFATACSEPAERFGSKILTAYAQTAALMNKALTEAKEYQFGDKAQMMRTALTGFQVPAWIHFGWFADSLAELAKLYKLDRRDFRPEDTFHLQESVWMRNVVNWIKGDEANDQAVVMRLFDWTCEAIVPVAEHGIGPAGEIRLMPWESMLISQGKGIDRAAVFMGLLRQYRIDSFLVRPADSKRDNPDFPVLVAAMVGGKALLFLPEWGLPIPGADGMSLVSDGEKKGLRFDRIASLDEAAADDAILRRLDTPDEKFPLSADDLKEVVALVPAGPFELSERMRIMEQEFSSNVTTVLAASFESLKEKISAVPGVARVEIGWEFQTAALEQTCLPEETASLIGPYLITMQAGKDLSTDTSSDKQETTPDGAKTGNEYTSPLHDGGVTISPLWGGKILYFAGRFTGENGAAYWLQQGKVPDRLLKQAAEQINTQTLRFIGEYQKKAAEEGQTVTEDQLKALAAEYIQREQQDIFFKAFLKTAVRFDLALVSRAIGNNDAATDHLRNQLQDTLLGQVGQVWQIPSLTLMARLLEEQGNYAEAIPIYRGIKNQPGRGSRLRAAWLEELSAK